jgi:hypothetical protein
MRVCVHMMWRGCVVYLYTGVKLSSWKGTVECEMYPQYWNQKGASISKSGCHTSWKGPTSGINKSEIVQGSISAGSLYLTFPVVRKF